MERFQRAIYSDHILMKTKIRGIEPHLMVQEPLENKLGEFQNFGTTVKRPLADVLESKLGKFQNLGKATGERIL